MILYTGPLDKSPLLSTSHVICASLFQTYIASSDKEFAAATIEAIGRVACSISEVTETCLHGLMSLLNHKNGEPHPFCISKGL